jgi:DNA-binding CsgD family transcriptional regulator
VNDDAKLWKVAAAELTPKQLHVYELTHRHRLSLRQISLALDISVSTVRTHLESADRKMSAALRRQAA